VIFRKWRKRNAPQFRLCRATSSLKRATWLRLKGVIYMAAIGPDFPKCPICGKDMKSVPLEEVPVRTRQEMVRYNRYQKLNPNYWYHCETDDIHIHKLAVKGK
jgi:hypothetical protein